MKGLSAMNDVFEFNQLVGSRIKKCQRRSALVTGRAGQGSGFGKAPDRLEYRDWPKK